MSEPVTVAIVGCGRLTEQGYLPAVALTPELRLVGVTDLDRDRRELVARLAGVPAFADLETLLADARPQGLVVATPATDHVAAASQAAAAGVVALVEKPPARDAAGAAALTRLTPPPRLGFNRRFTQGLTALRARVPRRGEVRLDLKLTYRRASWRPVQVHDDALLDLGPHVVDLARWLTGGTVLAADRAVVTDDDARFDLVLDRGVARVVIATDRPHREAVVVRNRRGRVLGRWVTGGLPAAVLGQAGAVVAARRGEAGRASPPSLLLASLTGQLRAFATVLGGEEAHDLGTAADGLAVMQALDAIRASAARRGRPVAVAPWTE